MPNGADLVGLSEVAELFGLSKQTVGNWRQRHADFPAPLAELRSGPVWRRADVLNWAQAAGLRVVEEGERASPGSTRPSVDQHEARVIAVSNMKGGVGKSTLTANLAFWFASRRNRRVLAVDLDPQFNLSQYLLGVSGYESLVRGEKPTVFEVFEQGTPSLSGMKPRKVLPKDVIASVTKPYGGGVLDLIPSRLELAWTLKNAAQKEQRLDQFLDHVRGQYDLVLIDCPPTDSMLTVAAYMASSSVLVPVRPEYLSTIGLPLLARSLDTFRDTYARHRIDVLGIVFNATQDKPEHQRAKSEVRPVAAEHGWYVFKHDISYSDSYPKGSRVGRPIFRTDYARQAKIEDFAALADEFAERVEL